MLGALYNQSSSHMIAKRPVFAVVIGISRYSCSSSYPNLCGAAEDADRFNHYLTHNLGVPHDKIYNLRNEDASREAIIESIFWLAYHPEIKKNETAIIIYFAGHGDLTDKNIQMICSNDIGTEIPSGNGLTKVEGISGAELAERFMDLSKAKGDNITIFLDTCHSTGMIQPTMSIRRSATQNEADQSPDGSVVFVEDLEQYTVISACGRDMQAFESGSNKSGFFTSRLLHILTSSNAECLTYVSLIHQLGASRMYMPPKQMPHCQGGRLYRPLFNFDPCLFGDPTLALGNCLGNGLIILYAGSVHGIVEGYKISVYTNNLADPARNPYLGELVVGSVGEFTSSLRCSPTNSANILPSLFYCKIVDSSRKKKTTLYSSEKSWLESIFPSHLQSRLSLNITSNDKNYDLRLDVSGEKVHFRQQQADNCVTTFVTDTWVAYKDDIQKIREIVKRYIHFYSHLELISPHHPGEIDIELDELAHKDGHFVPSKLCILDKDHVRIPADNTKKYGLTLRNRSMVKLYPYLFCFDPTDLTIMALYQPPSAGGKYGLNNEPDSPLLPLSEFTIGYGSNVLHGKRFSFSLRSVEQAAIAHLRLYLASHPVSFDSMIRETPLFSDLNQRGLVPDPEDDIFPEVWWMVKTTTFIIHR